MRVYAAANKHLLTNAVIDFETTPGAGTKRETGRPDPGAEILAHIAPIAF
jgi:hypothetical protein